MTIIMVQVSRCSWVRGGGWRRPRVHIVGRAGSERAGWRGVEWVGGERGAQAAQRRVTVVCAAAAVGGVDVVVVVFGGRHESREG